MARPKKWAHAIAGGQCRLDPSATTTYVTRACGLPPDTFAKWADKWRYEGWRYERQPRIGALPLIVNGYEDSLSFMLLVDALMRMDHHAEIYATTMLNILLDEYPHIVWDAQTVGRLMSTLAGMCAEEWAQRKRAGGQWAAYPPFFVREHVNGAYKYIVNPGAQNQHWIAQIREGMSDWHSRWITDAHAAAAVRNRPPTMRRGMWTEEVPAAARWGAPMA